MPREHEEIDDVPNKTEYTTLPEGSYVGHVWEKGDPITRQKKDGSGDFQMWPMAFRLTHKLGGEALPKPVVIRTDFFQNQMIGIKTSVGFPMQGKPVIVGVVVEEFEKRGDLQFEVDGKTVKMDFETGKPKRGITQGQISKVDRGEKGFGKAEVDLNPSGQAYPVNEMDAIDLEEGRTPDAPDTQKEEDLPF